MNKKFKNISILLFVTLITQLFPTLNNNVFAKNTNFLFNSYSQYKDKQNNTTISNTSTMYNMTVNPTIETKKIIIQTKQKMKPEEHKKILGTLGTYSQSIDMLNSFIAYVPENNIYKIKQNNNVLNIIEDSIVVGLETSTQTFDDNKSYIPYEIHNIKQSKYTGKNVTIAILDTGIEKHNDIKNNILLFKDFINNKTEPYDDNGHGTHVSGIISANGNYKGIAPDSKIISLKVLNNLRTGKLTDVLTALQWVLDNKDIYNIKIVNLSLGTDFKTYDVLMQMVDKLVENNITVVSAAGNYNLNSPAVSPKTIAVASTNSNNTLTITDDTISYFSPRTQNINNTIKPDIYTNGENVLSLGLNNSYIKMSGTSMSTPVISGVVALLLEQNPNLTPVDIKNLLLKNSTYMNGVLQLDTSKLNVLTNSIQQNIDIDNKNNLQPIEDLKNTSNTTYPITNSTTNSTNNIKTNIETKQNVNENKTNNIIPISNYNFTSTQNSNVSENKNIQNSLTISFTNNPNTQDKTFLVSSLNNEQKPRKEVTIPTIKKGIYNPSTFLIEFNKTYNELKKLYNEKNSYINKTEIEKTFVKYEKINKYIYSIKRKLTYKDVSYFYSKLK